jgi:hypothetical protein
MSLPGTHILTAVVVMPRAFNELSAMLSHLAKQTLASRLEIVLVHTTAGRGTIDPAAFAGFGAFKMVEVPSVPTVATGFVAGAARRRRQLWPSSRITCFWILFGPSGCAKRI